MTIDEGHDYDFENAVKQLNLGDIANLADMQEIVRSINVHNGWFESDRTFGDDIALLHSEVSEAFEAYRDTGNTEDQTVCTNGDPNCNCDDISYMKPEGVGSEFADILVRLLDSCERYGIDLEAEFIRKCKFNAQRGHRHGGKAV